MLAWIGKNTVMKFVYALKADPTDLNEALTQATKEANSSAAGLLKDHKYKEDDLNNL